MMKLRDKFNEPSVISILENVVDKLILISEQLNCFEFINKSKSHLIEQASLERCLAPDFKAIVQEIDDAFVEDQGWNAVQ
jgi:hypothetical protein